MNVHIKFLEHGKGSASQASGYVLSERDHLGHIRAGVNVLRGDATTFNAICDASPHLWKYTSGVIAWSKEDSPTDQQIEEVLSAFEEHAFAGLEPSQYHLFAVLHTDQDGAKHIHVLTPRLELETGKSLNIAPPGHEKHFDSLRDYFNTKYQWSRPDDLNFSHTTQEPNHIAKLNKQAKNILSHQEIETLPKKQFCKAVDNYVKNLLRSLEIQNRADLIRALEQFKEIESIRASKEFLTVILKNGKRHRLKGDFYHENFEIRAYTEHLRAAAQCRPTRAEIAAALQDAEQLRTAYRTKRATYHQQHYAVKPSSANDKHAKIAPTQHFDRNREFITPIPKNAVSELYGANRGTPSRVITYKYCGNQKSNRLHPFVFNFSRQIRRSDSEYLNRQNQSTKQYPETSRTSHQLPTPTNTKQYRNHAYRATQSTENTIQLMGNELVCDVRGFNGFLSRLSTENKIQRNSSTRSCDSTQQSNHPTATEINHADRNRPILDRTKQLIDSTDQFIAEHVAHLQRTRAELETRNSTIRNQESNTRGIDYSNEERAYQAGTRGIIRRLAKQCEQPINDCVESTQFRKYCQQANATFSEETQYSTRRHREGTLNDLANQKLLQRSRDASTANQYARRYNQQFSRIGQKLERLKIADIKLKPIDPTKFQDLRHDRYYPDYTYEHKRLCIRQKQIYERKDALALIQCIKEKFENLEIYMNRAHREISDSSYQRIETIIKNDQRMLKYLSCEQVLESQSNHLQEYKSDYESCLTTLQKIKTEITEATQPCVKPNHVEKVIQPEVKQEAKSDSNFDF